MVKHFLLFALSLTATQSHSQSLTPPTGGPYVLKQQVIAGGGNRASGGSFVLTGTVAQANAGISGGSALRLSSGFHTPQVATIDADIFKNGFEN